ncbi:MAG: hypothetical protein GY816_05765 [Cytophagales bacterium]|nr:hypothetical protein [Cytophagales bacterium]
MDFKQLQEEFRKLESDAGADASSALLQIMELKMTDFKTYIDQRFTGIQWTIGIAFTVLSLLIVLMNLIK